MYKYRKNKYLKSLNYIVIEEKIYTSILNYALFVYLWKDFEKW